MGGCASTTSKGNNKSISGPQDPEEEAAIKIQSRVRGMQDRKKVEEKKEVMKKEEDEKLKEEEELYEAATKIQSVVRGKQARDRVEEIKKDGDEEAPKDA